MQQESTVSLLPHSLPGRFFVPPKNLSCIISLPSHGEQLDYKPNPGWEGVSPALVASPLEAGFQQQGEKTEKWPPYRRSTSFPRITDIGDDGCGLPIKSMFLVNLENSLLFVQGSTILNFITRSNLICITLKITWAKVPLTEQYNIDGDSGKAITPLESVQAGCSPFGLWACKTKPRIYFLSQQLHFAWS